MIGPLLFAVLLALMVMILFVGFWRFAETKDPVDARLQEFGVAAVITAGDAGRRRKWPIITRLLNGFGLGPRLATSLMRADMRVTAAEYALLVVVLALLGFALGALRANPLMGGALAAVLGYLPIVYLNSRVGGRRRKLTDQLPDVLTLLVGGLRAGLGLTQAIDVVVRQIPDPAAKEFGRVTRAINLGQGVERALNDMAERAGSDDLDLVVSAMNVQYEMGGNLAETLDIIGETVRDRIRMKREIRTLTSQQRFTGYALALLPVVLGGILFLLNPAYMSELFQPGWMFLPIAGAVMMVVGFLIISKILDIEV